MASTLRLVFIGCGSIASHHLRALQSSGYNATVSAVVDKNKDTASTFAISLPKEYNCEVFSSLSECLDWGLFDAAVIMLPHHLHESHAVDCLRAGKHVLLEKPMAHTLPACVRLLKVAQDSSALLMIGEQSPHWPEVVKAKELINAGEIGELFFANSNYWESTMDSFADMSYNDYNWRFDTNKVGGGCLIDGATHWVRPLKTWFGKIDEVIGMTGFPMTKFKGETLANVLIRFASGHTARLYCHFNSIPMSPLPFFQIFGDKGEITIDGNFKGGMSIMNKENTKPVRYDGLGGYDGGFTPQMKQFLSLIYKGEKNVSNCCDALDDVLVAQAVYKSLKTKSWEKVTLDNVIGSTGTAIEF